MTTSADKEEVSRQQLLNLLRPNLAPVDLEDVDDAYSLSAGAHEQSANTETLQFQRCRRIAWVIAREFHIRHDSRIIIIALLHDATSSDVRLGSTIIERTFGTIVHRAVESLGPRPGETAQERLQRLAQIEDPDAKWRAIFVELVIRLQSLRTVHRSELDKHRDKRLETRKVHLPFIEQYLGTKERNQPHIEGLMLLQQKLRDKCREAES